MAAKRLYLVKEGKKLCGLCNGIAEYFDIDPSIVRIIWLLFTFMFGCGILAYIIGVFIVPNQPKDYYKLNER